MGQETTERDWRTPFEDVSSTDYLDYLRTEWGSELIPSMQARLRNMIEQREGMKAEYEEAYKSFTEKVAEAKALSQGNWAPLQEACKQAIDLSQSLERTREDLRKKDREIAEKADLLVKETRGSSPKPKPQPKRPFL
jgi:chromosome segregation ATPase